jgi:hypothetical protein
MAGPQHRYLTKCEHELRRAVDTGETVDLRSGNAELDDPVRGAKWGPERTVRAELIYELLVRYATSPRAVVLRGARISGGLNLEAATLACPFILEGCFCDGPINVREAQAPAIRLTGCQLPCVAADQLETRGDLDLSRSNAVIITLQGAHLGGDLLLNGTKLTGGTWPLDLTGVTQIPPADGDSGEDRQDRLALVADGLSIDGNTFGMKGFTAHGQVRLLGAHLGRQLIFDGARLNNDDGVVLFADRMNVGENMFCRDAEIHGAVRLLAAHINGQLVFNGATLSNEDEDEEALSLCEAQVAGSVWLRFAVSPKGAGGVDLTAARLGRVFDSEATWPGRLCLRGCVYSGVEATEDGHEQSPGSRWPAVRAWWRVRRQGRPDVQRRLWWIALAEEGRRAEHSRLRRVRTRLLRLWKRAVASAKRLLRLHRGSAAMAEAPGADGYAPQPYTQLMAYYRQEGRDGDVRRVAYERERRRRGELGLPGQAWNLFLRGTVGYGYKPLRALVLLAVLVLVGTLVFSSFHDDKDIPALRDEHPRFVALIYTLDRLIPVVSFGLRDAFAPTGAAQWWAFAYTLCGWVLTVAVLAGLNAAVRRD